MTGAEADKLLDLFHVHFPSVGLKRRDKKTGQLQINEEKYQTFKNRFLEFPYGMTAQVIGEFVDGRLVPGRKRANPELRDIGPVIRQRMHESACAVAGVSSSGILPLPFPDGTYVKWDSGDPLAGGIVRKRTYNKECRDYIDQVPLAFSNEQWSGRYLWMVEIRQPGQLARMRKMTPDERDDWIVKTEQMKDRGELIPLKNLPNKLGGSKASAVQAEEEEAARKSKALVLEAVARIQKQKREARDG